MTCYHDKQLFLTKDVLQDALVEATQNKTQNNILALSP